ncbi:MAG: TetR/AcrR family transcriptional regulator [Candidatus Binatia bacterium]
MRRAKEAYHHGDLRNALVAAAGELTERGGVDGFSLREAARAVGVSANAAYRHFADKSALLTAVAASGFEQLSRRMAKAMLAARDAPDAETAAVERFKAVGRAYVELAVEHPHMFRLMYGPSGLCRLVEESSALPSPSPAELLGQVLDELVAVGRLSPRHRAGAELQAWAVVHGFASLVLDGAAPLQRRAERAAALETLLESAVVGLCGRAAAPAGDVGGGRRSVRDATRSRAAARSGHGSASRGKRPSPA